MEVEVRHDGATRRMGWTTFEDEVRAGRVPPEAEVRCTPITGDRFVRADGLASWRGLEGSPEAAIRRALEARRPPWLTLTLCAALGLAWIPTVRPGGDAGLVARFGSLLPSVLDLGQAWRLLTATLVHTSPLHLAGNLLVVLWAGTWLERAWGRRDLALLLLASALASGAVSALAWPDRTSVGASGVAFGILGAAVTFGWRHAAAVPRRPRYPFGTFALVLLAVALASGLGSPEVNLWGHLAGLAAGGALGLLLGPGPARRAVRLWILASATGVLALPAACGPRLAPMRVQTLDGLACRAPATWPPARPEPGAWVAEHPAGLGSVRLGTGPTGGEAGVEAAADALVASAPAGASIRVREAAWVDGFPAVNLVFDVPDAPGAVHAVVVVRGAYVHTVRMDVPSGRIETLWRRIRGSVRLVEPDAVVEARAAVANSPRSATARALLASALEAAGDAGGTAEGRVAPPGSRGPGVPDP